MTGRTSATLAGLGAIVVWSTAIGVSRILAEALGPMSAGAAVFLPAGLIGCGWLVARRRRRDNLRRLRPRYMLACGGLFVVYSVCRYAAIGLAASRESVLVVGVINYLWPGMTLALSIPMLGKRARIWLLLGLVLAFVGGVLAVAPQNGEFWVNLCAGASQNGLPYALALGGAILWSVYSNLAKRWADGVSGSALPVFILASGVVLAAMSAPEVARWQLSWKLAGTAAFAALLPGLLAYSLWDLAMRRGSMSLVASAAHATPVMSMLVSCALLNVRAGLNLWIACVMVVIGAVVCRLSIR